MATDVKALELPPAEAFEEALKLYSKAHDALETITYRLCCIEGQYHDLGEFPEPVPTVADVGRVFSLCDGMRIYAAQLDNEILRLEAGLSSLDMMRLDH